MVIFHCYVSLPEGNWAPNLKFLEPVDPGYPKKTCAARFFLIILKQSEVDETQTSPDSEVNISACASI
jgi:hypothetical protein